MFNNRIKIITLILGFLFFIQNSVLMAQKNEMSIANAFLQLHKNSNLNAVEIVKLDFKTFHTQGMVKIDKHFFLSAVEVLEKTQTYAETDAIEDFSITRTAGKGRGWLFKFSERGNLISKLELTHGDAYHPGGIDFDGKNIWVPVGEYRPNSKSNIYKIDPQKMTADLFFSVDDHIGNMVYNPMTDYFHGSSWGGRRLYRWKLDENGRKISESWHKNPSHYIDYQDCHYAGMGAMLCGGVQTYQTPIGEFSLGGLELIDISADKVKILHQIPITKYLSDGIVLSHNPFWAEVLNGKLKLYFMPERNGHADLHTFDIELVN